MKKYRQTDSKSQVASEPSMSYNKTYVDGLKQRLISNIDESNDEERLLQCLEIFYSGTMPCMFSEEELSEEIILSEESGEATNDEVESIFKKWIN